MAWHLLKKGEAFGTNSEYMEFLIDSVDDIETPPTDKYSYAPASIAHTPGWKHVYEAGSDASWTEIGE